MAMGRGFSVEGARRQFGLQVAIEYGLYGLPDVKGFQRLHIGRSIEENDALDEIVCMLHLFNRFFAPRLGQHLVAPVVEQTVMQPVLVHRGELVAQRVIEVFDDFFFALHALLLFAGDTPVGAWILMFGLHDGEFRASALSVRAVWGIYRSPGAATQGKGVLGVDLLTVRHT